jgi:lysophospholipase L1-like esterase
MQQPNRLRLTACIAILIGLVGQISCPAAPFRDGDVVCFLGDSITKGGLYPAFIELFYVTRFPEWRIDFHNCGCGGDRASSIMEATEFRLDADVFARKPTHVVVMLGINDVERSLYGLQPKSDNVAIERQAALDRYAENLDAICRRVCDSGAELILVTPSCYDETALIDAPGRDPLKGVNDALAECAAVVRHVAAVHGAILADAHALTDRVNREEQARDPRFSITGAGKSWNDRVHPGPVGSFLIAFAVLAAQGPFPPVATIAVDTSGKTQPERCTIEDVDAGEERVAWTCREQGLPCVVPVAAREGLRFVPFAESFNQEIVRCEVLAPGMHALVIDGREIGVFTAGQFASGVNLATLPIAPQYRQAELVAVKAEAVRRAGENLREPASLRYYRMARANAAGGTQPQVDWRSPADYEAIVRATLLKQPDPKNPSGWLRAALAEVTQPGDLSRIHAEAVAELRRTARPVAHRYEITRRETR